MKASLIKRLSLVFVTITSLFIAACSEREAVDAHIEKEKKKKEAKAHGHSHGEGHDHDHADGGNHDDSHAHEETPHHGVMEIIWSGQKKIGYAELKLHDDKGDLELWLSSDKEGTTPLDLPLNSEITITFSELEDKKVTLRVRNSDKNEDEDGKANIREGKTNYFIFPGDTGADATFLMGKEFVSKVVIFYKNGEVRNVTDEFELRPHTH